MKMPNRGARLIYIILAVFALCVIALCALSQVAHAAKMYWGTSLTGGGDALDGIDGATLSAGDAALVMLDSSGAPRWYFYRAYASGTTASSPTVIAPATNAGSMRWHLAQRSERIDALSISAGSVTNTVFDYISTLTSNAQTQLNGKASTSHNHAAADTNSGTFSIARGGTNSAAALSNYRVMVSVGGAIIEHSALTAGRALYTDSNGLPAASAVTSAELGYLSGVTSAIQTQLGTKAGKTGTPTAGHVATWYDANTVQDGGVLRTDNSTASHFPYIDSSGNITNAQMGAGITETAGTLAMIFGASNPATDGTASPGAANSCSRSDHVHGHDTAKQDALTNPVTAPGSGATVGHVAVCNNTGCTSIVDGGALPTSFPGFSATNPSMDATAAPGSGAQAARYDHVHPSDTSRAALSGTNSFTGGNTIGDYSANQIVRYRTPSTGGTFSGLTIQVTAATGGLAAGDMVYINSSGQGAKARADAAGTLPAVCIAPAAISAASTGDCLVHGTYRWSSSPSYTTGGIIHVSAATAGASTTTAPSTSTNIVQRVGIALAADAGYYKFDLTTVTVP